MKTQNYFIKLMVFVIAILLSAHSHAASDSKAPTKEQVKDKDKDKQLQTPLVPYVPPKPIRPTPKIRTSQGGTRGCGGLPTVTLLAPEHVGLTTQEQPKLYWHISAESQKLAVVTLTHDEAIEPLLEWSVPKPMKSGVHSINIAKHDIHLEVGKTYEWSLRMVCGQGESDSGDLVVKSYIERVPVSDQVKSISKNGDSIVLANAYASGGLWYDAVATLHKTWVEDSDNPILKSAWSGMLGQIELIQP